MSAARRELTVSWAASLGFVGALCGLQPGWQTDIVSTLVLAVAAAATGVRFVLTPQGHRLVHTACGEGLAADAIHYVLDVVHHWREAGVSQPAWH